MMLLHPSNRQRHPAAVIALCIMLSGIPLALAQSSPDVVEQETLETVELSSVEERLIERLGRRFDVYQANDVSRLLQDRRRLTKHRLTVLFQDPDRPEMNPDPLLLTLEDHPSFVVFDHDTRAFIPDERSIRYFLEASTALPRAEHAIARRSSSGSLNVQGSASAGYVLDPVVAASAIVSALEGGKSSVVIDVRYHDATLLLFSDTGVSELQLLSRGMSDFAKSPYGREANVRRALEAYLNGIIIEKNQEFSFNDALSNSFGWREALIIAEGGKLVQEPGGGICQAASTVFRAALLAGLPVIKRANHSLYVGYYEEYGVGLDATIYPGKQDLTFKNDTGAPLIMAARSEGTQAIVEFYGKSDGRTVSLEGPFFSTSNDGFEKKLSIKQIGWNYGVTYPDGRIVEKSITSTYTMLPKLIRTKYAEAQGIGLLSELAANPVQGELTMVR